MANHFHYLERFVDGVGLIYTLFSLIMLAFYVFREFALTILIKVFTLVWNILTCGGEKGKKT